MHEGSSPLAQVHGQRLTRFSGSHQIFTHPQIRNWSTLQKSMAGRLLPEPQLLRLVERIQSQPGETPMKDYHFNTFFSDEDEGYIADGETREQALAKSRGPGTPGSRRHERLPSPR